ncbi:hypothetical protein A0130_13555 [Leifsonia xyli]|uniref:hypothetical protein n=1 Tax=Leifsonia xyli TaxID=1575 RepID=UPI0007CDD836|nr:hypothetical protein A0130_13555 [Leifsonia xyli]
MKSAFILSEDPALFETFSALIVAEGGRTAGHDYAQISDRQGRIMTVFALESDDDLSIPPDRVVGMPPLSPLSSLAACSVEFRWEQIVVHWFKAVAREVEGGAWLLDSDGVLWSVHSIDPEHVNL